MNATFKHSLFVLSLVAGASLKTTAQVTLYNSGVATTISSGVTVTVDGNFTNKVQGGDGSVNNQGTIQVSGNWTNDATNTVFSSLAGTTVFYGSTAQAIDGTGTTRFYNMTINKSASDVTLNTTGNMIDNQFNLASRNLVLGANHFILGASATITGTPGATSYVEADGTGTLQKRFTATGSFSFPVGDNDDYSPFAITVNSATFAGNDFISARVTDNTHPLVSSPDYISRYWTISSGGFPTLNYDVSYNYTDADVSGFETNISAAFHNGSGWTMSGAANILTNTLSTNASLTTAPAGFAFTGFGSFVLPVHLLAFDAHYETGKVIVEWSMAAHNPFDYFEVEKSTNGRDFSRVGKIQAAASLNGRYLFSDPSFSSGTAYYRLRQIDADGRSTFSKSVRIQAGGQVNRLTASFQRSSGIIKVMPLTVSTSQVSVLITSTAGYRVRSAKWHAVNGTVSGDINVANLQTGIYSVTVTDGARIYTTQVLVNR